MVFNTHTGNLPLYQDTVTLLNGQTESEIIRLEGQVLLSIYVPTGFSGAQILFKVDNDLTDVNLKDFYKTDGTQVALTAVADTCVGIVPVDFPGVHYLQLVSDTAQSGDVDFIIKVRTI